MGEHLMGEHLMGEHLMGEHVASPVCTHLSGTLEEDGLFGQFASCNFHGGEQPRQCY